jgi:hypothetical protein
MEDSMVVIINRNAGKMADCHVSLVSEYNRLFEGSDRENNGKLGYGFARNLGTVT